MFVLIHADDEMLFPDYDAMAFSSYEKAHGEMLRQFKELCNKEGAYQLGNITELGDVVDGDGCWFGYVDKRNAYLEDANCSWAIFEVPGVLIPSDVAEGIREDVAEMESIYADENVDEKWDADDIAIDVARTVASLVG